MTKVLIAIFLTSMSIINAQNLIIRNFTDKNRYMIGDYITYNLEIKYPANYKITLPNFRDSIKQLDYIKAENPKMENVAGKIIYSQKIIFSKYEQDTIVIPELVITLKDKNNNLLKGSTSPIELIIDVFQVSESKDIVDIKKPVKVPFDWLIAFFIFFGILLLASVLYFIWRRYGKSKTHNISEAKIILPPYQVALDKLSELESKKLWQQGFKKLFHSEITEIIRKYFEDEFQFTALEMTSNEIMCELRKIQRAQSILIVAENFFANADMVKFAKFQPLPSVNEDMIKLAYEIVSVTKKDSIKEEMKNV